MKKIALILFASMLFVSCNNNPDVIINVKKPNVKVEKVITNPIIDSIYVNNSPNRIIRVYEIDGCEYVGDVRYHHSDILTHKGNCKYCLARQNSFFDKVLKLLK